MKLGNAKIVDYLAGKIISARLEFEYRGESEKEKGVHRFQLRVKNEKEETIIVMACYARLEMEAPDE